MSSSPLAHQEIAPAETYQIDTSDYDSDEAREGLDDEEYDRLVEEAEDAFDEDQVKEMLHQLKERGIIHFLRSYLATGTNGELASLRKLLLGFGIIPPRPLRDPSTPNEALVPFTKVALSRILRRREKLPQYNSVQDAIDLLRTSRRIIVLSGAGISTSCGIPDFRSANGLYANLQREGKYELDDPQQMFDIRYFVEHPEVFYSFAKQIYPSNFTPSPCHRWIKLLEDKGVLLRNYTQNIDTLESLAGVENVLQCHGSFKTASCLRCKTRVPGRNIEPYIMSSRIPYCGECRQKRDTELAEIEAAKLRHKKAKGKGKANGWGGSSGESEEEVDEWGGGPPGIIKALDSEFDECLYKDREEVDLLIIIGTSLKVAPVSEVLAHIPHSVPQIFINLTPITHVRPDICLLGDADSIVTFLARQVGWDIPPPAVVIHSPSAESKVAPEDDILPRPPQAALKVPPEDAKWESGVGDMSHIHVLSSTRDAPSSQGTPNGVSRDQDTSGSEDLPTAFAKPVIPSISPEHVDEGYETDDERPSKRARTGAGQ